MAPSTRALSKRENAPQEESSRLQRAISMMVNSTRISATVSENLPRLLEQPMRATSRMVYLRVKENTSTRTVTFMKVNLNKDSELERES